MELNETKTLTAYKLLSHFGTTAALAPPLWQLRFWRQD